MMTDKHLIARLLEFLDKPNSTAERQAHTEQVADERPGVGDGTVGMQIEQMLNEGQMHELVEQVAFAKRAFKNEEALSEELPIAYEWEKFAAIHAEELDALDEDEAQPHFSLRKILGGAKRQSRVAASFIGILLASGIALAAIHLWNHTSGASSKERGVYSSVAEKTNSKSDYSSLPESEAGGEAFVTFDNVPLDTMLIEMADYYHVSVEFEREEARQLRFHFVWKRTDDLDRLVEKLNSFEALNIIREPETLIVR